jgi:hypothetical protein
MSRGIINFESGISASNVLCYRSSSDYDTELYLKYYVEAILHTHFAVFYLKDRDLLLFKSRQC